MSRATSKDTGLPALGVLFVVGLIGCGSSPNARGSSTTVRSSSSASTAAGRSPSSAASGEASGPGASGHPIDVCTTLPAASAAKLSDQPITRAVHRAGLQPGEYGCAYGNDDDTLQVEVTVFEHDAAFSYNTFLSGTKDARPVNGLGDKAFFDNDGTMYVLAGSNLIQVNGLKTAEQCAALARPIIAAL